MEVVVDTAMCLCGWWFNIEKPTGNARQFKDLVYVVRFDSI